MKYYQVKITRDLTLAFTQEVGKWEIPLLELMNGPENVEVEGEIDVRRDYPDAPSEYERLLRRYKNRDEQNRLTAPPVELVYGVGSRGVSELAKVIADERRAHPYKPSAPKAPKAAKQSKASGSSDAEVEELKKQLEALQKDSREAIERAEQEAEEAKAKAFELEKQFEELTSPEG